MELNANHFVIPIDDRIQGFRNLTTLALSNNDFVGTLPSTLDKLTNLQHFEMGSNPNLGGSVVESIVHWPNLEHMDISETNVTGTIPSEFGRLSRLTSLGIWDVPLSGTIPSEVGNLVAIGKLKISVVLLSCCDYNERFFNSLIQYYLSIYF